MTAQRLDLSALNALDLQSLRLGAQVMEHRAELADRPRVEFFFKGLQLTVDEELARRKRVPDDKPLVSLRALPLAPAAAVVPAATPSDEDRRLAAECLDLLQGNNRLSSSVRSTFRILREQLGPDS